MTTSAISAEALHARYSPCLNAVSGRERKQLQDAFERLRDIWPIYVAQIHAEQTWRVAECNVQFLERAPQALRVAADSWRKDAADTRTADNAIKALRELFPGIELTWKYLRPRQGTVFDMRFAGSWDFARFLEQTQSYLAPEFWQWLPDEMTSAHVLQMATDRARYIGRAHKPHSAYDGLLSEALWRRESAKAERHRVEDQLDEQLLYGGVIASRVRKVHSIHDLDAALAVVDREEKWHGCPPRIDEFWRLKASGAVLLQYELRSSHAKTQTCNMADALVTANLNGVRGLCDVNCGPHHLVDMFSVSSQNSMGLI